MGKVYKKRLLNIIVMSLPLFGALCKGSKQYADSITFVQFEAHKPQYERRYPFTANPTAYKLLPMVKTTRVSGETNTGKSSKDALYIPYDGNSYRDFAFSANGYNAFSANGAIVSGAASYSNRLKRNTRWNNYADYALFYPYLLADSVGGDYYSESYKISGSYAYPVGNAVFVGGKLAYRGAQAYRKADPRPNNVVSEIAISAGALCTLDDRHQLGAYLTFENYKQLVSIRSYKADRKDRFFSMNGMGLYDFQLSVIDNQYARYLYSNAGYVGLHYSRADNTGVAAFLKLSKQNSVQEVSAQRQPYRGNQWRSEASVSHQWQVSAKSIVQTELFGRFSLNKGTEIKYDTMLLHRQPDIIGYEKTYEAVKHRMTQHSVGIAGIFQHDVTAKSYLYAKAAVGNSRYVERYLYPKYSMGVHHVFGGLMLGGAKHFGRLSGNFSVNYKLVSPIQRRFEPPPHSPIIVNMLVPYYEYVATRKQTAKCQTKWMYAISNRLAVELSAYGQVSFICASVYDIGANLALVF